MQKYFLLFFLVFVSRAFAQGPDWEWAVSAGGDNCEYPNCMASDLDGNVSVTGIFRSSTLILGHDTLHNFYGFNKFFLARFDKEGNCLWGRTLEKCNYGAPLSITVDDLGNTYILSYLSCDTVIIGTDTIFYPNNIGSNSLLKYDSTGNVLWVQLFDFSSIGMHTLMADPNGMIYLTGYFNTDSIIIGSTVLFASMGKMFIAKFDSDGNVLWARNGGSNYVWPGAIQIREDKIYVTGNFIGYLEFDSISYSDTSSNNNMFLIQFDTSGHANWITSAGGIGDERGYSLACDQSNNIYVTGTFSGDTMNFDSLVILNTIDSVSNDIFLAKYNDTGEVIWAIGEGGLDDDNPAAVVVSGNDVYLSGRFRGGIMLLDTTFIFSALPYYPGMFVAKYDTSGNLIWPYCPQGSGYEDCFDMSISGSETVYITGSFGGTNNNLYFGSHVINSQTQCDIFLAKMNLLTGIEETSKQSFLLYPNPAQQKITIHASSLHRGDVEIYNSLGMLIKRFDDMKFPAEIDISFLKSGLYFIRIESFDKFLVQKFIVE